MAISHLMLKL